MTSLRAMKFSANMDSHIFLSHKCVIRSSGSRRNPSTRHWIVLRRIYAVLIGRLCSSVILFVRKLIVIR